MKVMSSSASVCNSWCVVCCVFLLFCLYAMNMRSSAMSVVASPMMSVVLFGSSWSSFMSVRPSSISVSRSMSRS